MDVARLILSTPDTGAWNMAVDQALLETANRTGLITLRFYSWSEPTLSLGYFQNHADRSQHPASLKCPLIRRRTGGGAILHDHEITYSLSVPNSHRWSSRNTELYRAVHQIMIDLLAEHGVDSAFHSDQIDRRPPFPESDPREESFMCFQRRSDGDVVLNQHKIIGSAQRRLKKSLLQHGSILLRRSPFAPELPGISDLSGFEMDLSHVIEKVAEEIGRRLQIDFVHGKLAKTEQNAAENAFSLLFNNKDWNFRR